MAAQNVAGRGPRGARAGSKPGTLDRLPGFIGRLSRWAFQAGGSRGVAVELLVGQTSRAFFGA